MSDNPMGLPWVKRSPQVKGRQREQNMVKKAGGRPHPMSGAGSIKWDGSTEDGLIEIKDAASTHSIKGKMLDDLARDANAQGKDAYYIVNFESQGVRLVGRVERI